MKVCTKCEAILPNNYKVCPECKSVELTQLKYTPIEEDEAVSVSPFVECGELKCEEL